MVYSENILICIVIPLLISLLFTRKSTRRFITSLIFGMVICLISAYISGFISFVLEVDQEYTAVYYSPIIEEIMKILPLIFYVIVFEPADDRIFIAALGLGLGFATFENCCYILSGGAEQIAYVLVRGLAVGVMHLVCALVMVTGICTVRRFKAFSLSGVIGVLSLSAVFHGLYNLLVSEPGVPTYIGYFLPMVSAVLLYIPYSRLYQSGNMLSD
ncbi:MAG: PrsW family intramembrane metalloprotease [Lachnospiraceae bacterium]|nr:PrsW family intramembrane metalloprotease [Lachnospiraceae bacterium]